MKEIIVKTRIIKLAAPSFLALAMPLVTFAAGQPAKVRMPERDEAQNRAGIAQAVHQGKGSGMSRTQADREVNGVSASAHVKWGDSAFTK
jgi:hypothetical protein